MLCKFFFLSLVFGFVHFDFFDALKLPSVIGTNSPLIGILTKSNK